MESQSRKIVVIDDEPEIRNAISRFLIKRGYQVFLAATLNEGKSKVGEESPDLVFLDVNLPDGNGLEELAEFSENSRESTFIVMSAFSHSEARKKAIYRGAKDFLSKPFSIQQLNLIVQQYI